MKFAYDCMMRSERSCGSIVSWIFRHVMPASTVIVRSAGESATTLSILRMSMKSAPGAAIWPPML